MKKNDSTLVKRNVREEKRKKVIYAQRIQDIFKYVIITLIVYIIAVNFLGEAIEIKNVFFTYNVKKQLNYMYNGNFTILSPEIDEDANVTPNGVYTIRSDNGIEFNAYKNSSFLKTDYAQYLYKQYVLDYIKKYGDINLVCKDSTMSYMGTTLYSFEFGIQIDNYNELDKGVKNLYNLCKYINQRAKKDLKFESVSYSPNIYLNNFEGNITENVTDYSLKYYMDKVKIGYVNYLFDNNLSDPNVSEEELIKYHKPQELKVFVNGVACVRSIDIGVFECKAQYDISNMEYGISFFKIIQYITSIESYELGYNGSLNNFIYNGKKYYFDGNTKDISGEKVPYYWTMPMLKSFFGAQINYDFVEKTVEIDV